jgi:E3 ubiquitin-protein ligase BRE1
VRLLSENVVTSSTNSENPFPTSLQFKNNSEFSDHLSSKSKEIKEKVNALFSNITASTAAPPSDLTELRGSLTKLLAAQKEHMVKLDRLRAEKEQLGERLETASLRYIKAEKKLDRLKSAAVAKVEQQAINGTSNNSGSGIGGVDNGRDTEMANGIKEDSTQREGAELAYKEASAVVAKQKEQLEALLAENKSLTEQLTATNVKLANLSDDDYSRTELFKHFRTQHEEVIKRINHLEATNIQLREEAEKYQAERTLYKTQVEAEAQLLTGELESQLQRLETDLTRIRSTRDELLADQSIRKAGQEQEREAVEHLKELVGAKDDRITALELEVERIRAQLQQASPTAPSTETSNSSDDLRQKYEELEKSFESVNKELPAMEKAYKRSMAMASKKVMDFTALEEKVAILLAEKSKADQKYFAARKDMDTRINDARALRTQNGKSSEIISQLKEVEKADRVMISNLEKQLSDLRQANTSVMVDNKKLQTSSSEATTKLELLKKQVSDLNDMLKSKDSSQITLKKQTQAIEAEHEQLRVRYEHIQKDRDSWKAKSMSNQSGEEEMLRVSPLFPT